MTLHDVLEQGRVDRLARKVGVRREYISRIRSGRVVPSFDLALRISAATAGEVSVEQLMGQSWRWPAAARLRENDPFKTPEEIAKLDFWLRCMRNGIDPTDPDAARILADVELPEDESFDLPRAAGQEARR